MGNFIFHAMGISAFHGMGKTVFHSMGNSVYRFHQTVEQISLVDWTSVKAFPVLELL
jgi:hypothetical protein